MSDTYEKALKAIGIDIPPGAKHVVVPSNQVAQFKEWLMLNPPVTLETLNEKLDEVLRELKRGES